MDKEYIMLQVKTEGQEDRIQSLKELLEQFCIDITYSDEFLYFNFEKDKIKNVKTRGAGRKSIMSEHTIREVFDYSLSHSAAETAQFAGISMRTYQRHVAKYKVSGFWSTGSQIADMLYFGQ